MVLRNKKQFKNQQRKTVNLGKKMRLSMWMGRFMCQITAKLEKEFYKKIMILQMWDIQDNSACLNKSKEITGGQE